MERDREAWRKRARAKFKELGRGSQARCARELRVSEAEVSHLLSGRIGFSHWVIEISRWLKIAPPSIGYSEAHARLQEAAGRLNDEQVRKLTEFAEMLAAKNKP